VYYYKFHMYLSLILTLRDLMMVQKHVVLIVIKFMRTFTLLCWMVLSIYLFIRYR